MSFDLFADAEAEAKEDTRLTGKRERFLEECRADPFLYVWGKDPETNRAIVLTKDAWDPLVPMKPMPTWPYLFFVLRSFMQHNKVVVDKPRQLMVSWLMLLWFDWNALFLPYRRILLNKSTEEEASNMIRDRIDEAIHANWPAWFKEWAGAEWKQSEKRVYYNVSKSDVKATGENADVRQARGDQAWIFGVDEAALHPRLREVVAALSPMAKQTILVSTPELGHAGAAYMAEILKEE